MKRLFLLGAAGYPALELLYRGRTHYSMSIAGGASALLIGHISRFKLPCTLKPFLCAVGITGIEALCGNLWNRRYTVWDYRNLRWNWKGQICLRYSMVWLVLSATMLGIMAKHQK